ncbi:MAG: sulfatase [Bdellovibrionota bacterium]
MKKLVKNFTLLLSKLLTILLVSFSFISLVSCYGKPKQKNVIFILIDTLRADHLSYYGYERDTTPNIDAFAKESLVFKNAFSPAPWTPAAMASIFTGTYTTTHGMVPPNSREEALRAATKLSDKVYTLSELFKDNGYYTMAVQTNPWLTETFGYAQGFDTYIHKNRIKAKAVNNEAYNLINDYLANKENKNKPFYLYLHYMDPHNPYEAPREYDRYYKDTIKGDYNDRAQELIRRYDREIKYTDDKLGELFNFLKEKKLYKNSVIVFLTDHGEQFFERGHQGHGFYLYNEEIHVPFFIRAKGHKGEVLQAVSSIDLFETLVDLNKLKNDKSTTQGFSLISKEGLEQRKRTDVLSEIKRKFQQKAIITTNLNKLINEYSLETKDTDILNITPDKQRVFDISSDALEKKEVHDDNLFNRLNKRFIKVYSNVLKSKITLDKDDSLKMDEKTASELKSLGYL